MPTVAAAAAAKLPHAAPAPGPPDSGPATITVQELWQAMAKPGTEPPRRRPPGREELARRLRLAQEVVLRRRRQPALTDSSTFSALHIDGVASLPSGHLHVWGYDLGRAGAGHRRGRPAAVAATVAGRCVIEGEEATVHDEHAGGCPQREEQDAGLAPEGEERVLCSLAAEPKEELATGGPVAEAEEAHAPDGPPEEGVAQTQEEQDGGHDAPELPKAEAADILGACGEEDQALVEEAHEVPEEPQEELLPEGAEGPAEQEQGAVARCSEAKDADLGSFFQPKSRKKRSGQPKQKETPSSKPGAEDELLPTEGPGGACAGHQCADEPDEEAEPPAAAEPPGASAAAAAGDFAAARAELLRWRSLAAGAGGAPPPELATLAVGEAAPPPASKAMPERPPGSFVRQQTAPGPPSHQELPWRRMASSPAAAGPGSPGCAREELKRTVVPVPADDLRRSVQSLLNKVCPENISQIVGKLAAVEVSSCEQLETIIELIFKKALAEPHYCETYADLVFSLKSVFPEFPSPTGGKPLTFKSAVLNICQGEFEQLLLDPEPPCKACIDTEELEFQRKQRRDRMRANMKFVGHLFLRQLLSVKVVGSVVCELVSCYDPAMLPEEHAIECAIELCMAIGHTLEALPVGQSVLGQVCGRLLELKGQKTDAGKGKGAYSKRVQFQILDLLETRSAGWSKKSFTTSAKTKDEIRQEQEREGSRSGPERAIAGLRPEYLSPISGG